MKLIETNTNVRDALHNKTMMALPAFESSMKVDEDDVSSLAVVPRDKKDVLRQLFNRAEPFHLKKFRRATGQRILENGSPMRPVQPMASPSNWSLRIISRT